MAELFSLMALNVAPSNDTLNGTVVVRALPPPTLLLLLLLVVLVVEVFDDIVVKKNRFVTKTNRIQLLNELSLKFLRVEMKLNLRIDKLQAPNGHALPFPCRFVLSSDAHRAESIAIESLDAVIGKTLTLMLPERDGTVGGELSVVTAPSNTILKSLFGGTESVRYASGFWFLDELSQLPVQTTILFTGDDDISSTTKQVLIYLSLSRLACF